MRVVYVSHTSGVHDHRWIDAFQSNGLKVASLVLPNDQDALSKTQRAVDQYRANLVVAGPLITCTRLLLNISVPLIGLSWGHDLHDIERETDSGHWLHSMSGLIVDSDRTREIALACGMSPEGIFQIPWGVDLTLFRPDGERPSNDFVSEADRVILSARAHEPIYRVQDVVAAFQWGESQGLWGADVHLVILNSGSLTPTLERFAGPSIHFVGRVSEPVLAMWLRRADVYVSASEVDGSSVTLLQAMACGAPVVASDIPGNQQWVLDEQIGQLFPQGDLGSLAASIAKTLNQEKPDTGTMKAMEIVKDRADWQRNIHDLGTFMNAMNQTSTS